jgi:acetyl esterase/lipase
MLALDPQWLEAERAAVRGFAGLAGPYDFLPLDDPSTIAAFGQAPNPKATQPTSFASAGDPPALLLVAGEDRLVLPRNSIRLAARLREAGVPVEVKTYPQLGHIGILTAIARPLRGKAPVLRDLGEFARTVTAEGAERASPPLVRVR